ncbi:S-adenosyl-L-methionine-dependent methyltransferase [Dactylonectria macrodidyma]|uniref:S-adenosyl-L-methionine-dependent methyltransferase n=1 Tax=Dactylonectria macrodidyma TaxID=307937 RepID=A0A9P9F922_9HYPO|nr:S-adenosyl-L-methionine-dependent methyltransferase [Dactylonectria macrodidyma]
MHSDDDQRSFSLISISDIGTIHDLTEQDTDEFELIYRDQDAGSLLETASSSDSTSVPPDFHAHEFEHGRRYHSYKSGRYPLPNDIGEQEREETAHALMLQLMDGKLFLSDIGDAPQKILDIGTGTGTWAIDVADLYPSASVVGTDLSPIQPRWMPINARMFVEDCEDPEWMHGCGFDLVHLRGVAGVLLDLDAVVANAYCNIINGGWIELQEFDPLVLCDDGTMEEGDKDLRRTLEHAGFKRIQVVTKQVPISAWSSDKKLKTVGSLMKANILEALDGFAAKPLVALGMSVKERRDLVADVLESLDDDRVHRYINCHFCYGQKDEQEEVETDSDSDSDS